MTFRPPSKQLSIFGPLTVLLLFASWLVFFQGSKYTVPFLNSTLKNESPSWRDQYYQQVFGGSNQTSENITSNLSELCRETEWRPNLYLNCTEIAAGLFNQVNEIKNCIRMAIDAGAALILPSINERNSSKLYSFHDEALRFRFGHFWDEAYIIDQLERSCPQMKVLPSDEPPIAEAKVVTVDAHRAPDFKEYLGYFDGTRTFRAFADKTVGEQNFTTIDFPIILRVTWTFLATNPENDPTGLDWRAWTELSLLLRPTEIERQLVQRLTESQLLKKDSYIGVHLRVETDAIGKWWDNFDMQAAKNLKAIDVVAKQYREGPGNGENPYIFVACGDPKAIEKFKQLAAKRGYSVVDKWGILANDTESLSQLDTLSFDAKGLLDYAVLLNSYFFLGTLGSSFSYTVANMRSDLGRYPGSSFVVNDAGNSFSHLFMPPSKRANFPCCL
ncbi:hypothetical protein TWF696_007865 [Orbilia brochopaga]|uniref:Uncharacterized protein n=1 Tax=Orbilia brochopaga TaxID=3140254 RepID=A0AAV9UQX3_9PEZI